MNPRRASFSLASLIAIVAAFSCFFVGAFYGLMLAATAFTFGIVGIFLALSPWTRGGGLSIIAVLLSLCGVVASMFKSLLWLFGA